MAKDKSVEVEEVEEVEAKHDSEAKSAYRKIIEAYAKQNPVKFEAKKAVLYAKLETL